MDSEGLTRLKEALAAKGKAKAALAAAEESLKIVFSELMVKYGSYPASKATHLAHADFSYREAADRLADARGAYEDANAEAEYLDKRWETWRTNMATQRIKMQMKGTRYAGTETEDESAEEIRR